MMIASDAPSSFSGDTSMESRSTEALYMQMARFELDFDEDGSLHDVSQSVESSQGWNTSA
jgi:hypothetical protein